MNNRQNSIGGGISGHIFEQIISLENLLAAWREFRRGKNKKIDVMRYAINLEDRLWQLHYELKSKSYQPDCYLSFFVADPKLRHIHKASVRDRIVHQAIYRILYPCYDKKFIFDSYACRLQKGTHKAVDRLSNFCRQASKNYTGVIYGLQCDIWHFFDSIDHVVLKELIGKIITDRDTLWLINKIIDSFVVQSERGLPLGNVTSQLFANIYLNEFDQFVKRKLKIKYYLRYTDDFIIISADKCYLDNLIVEFAVFLYHRLSLSLHQRKTTIRKFSQGFDCLGYVALPYYWVLRTKTKRRIFKKINKQYTLFNEGIIDTVSFNQSLQSYLGILSHCRAQNIKQNINKSINLNALI